jgi:hypothetical protein
VAVVAHAAPNKTSAAALEELLNGGSPEVFVHQVVTNAMELSERGIVQVIRGC